MDTIRQILRSREEEREVGGEVGRKGSDDESIETPAIFREVGP